jgi:hypothetical protein
MPNKSRAPCLHHQAKARRIAGQDDIAGPRKGWRYTWKASAIRRCRKAGQDTDAGLMACHSLNSGEREAGAIPVPCVKGARFRRRQ